MTHLIQLSGRCGDVIAVIGGSNPAEFQDNLMAILGPDSLEVAAQAFKVAIVDGIERGTLQVATDNVISAGMAKPADAVTQPQTPATQPQNSVHTEKDRWNNEFTYAIPGAPSCPHGVRVQKKGTSQAGKAYTGWVCPTQTPHAFRNKIQKAECSMEFAARG